MRQCACNCGQTIPATARATRRYVNERHKDAAYQARLRKRLQDAGLPTSLSLKVADANAPTGSRRTDGHNGASAREKRRATPSTVRISYLRTLDAITNEMRRLNTTQPRERAFKILDTLLTDHQREILDG